MILFGWTGWIAALVLGFLFWSCLTGHNMGGLTQRDDVPGEWNAVTVQESVDEGINWYIPRTEIKDQGIAYGEPAGNQDTLPTKTSKPEENIRKTRAKDKKTGADKNKPRPKVGSDRATPAKKTSVSTARTKRNKALDKTDKRENKKKHPQSRQAKDSVPAGFQKAPSKESKCARDPKRCVTFSDGYKAGLREGDVVERRSVAQGRWGDKPIEIAQGRKQTYYHPTDTELLRVESTGGGEAEDCIAYTPAKLRVDRADDLFIVSDGLTPLLTLANESNSQKALEVAKRYIMLCFIGREDDGDVQSEYIVQYWK